MRNESTRRIGFFVPKLRPTIEINFPRGSFIMHLISHHDTERSTKVRASNTPTPVPFYITFYTVREEEEGVKMKCVMYRPVG
jgi:hypothetical protein